MMYPDSENMPRRGTDYNYSEDIRSLLSQVPGFDGQVGGGHGHRPPDSSFVRPGPDNDGAGPTDTQTRLNLLSIQHHYQQTQHQSPGRRRDSDPTGYSSVQGSSAPLPDPQVTLTYDQGDHNDRPPVLPHFERYGSVMQMRTPQPPQPTFSGYYQGNLTQAVPPAPAPAAPPDHSRSVTPTVYTPQSTLVVALGGHQGDPSHRDNVHLPPPSHHRHPVTQPEMHTPQTTFDDYQGNAPQNLPIPSDHSRSMRTPQSTLGNYQGNAALVPIIPPDLSRSHSLYTPFGPYPGAMQTPIPGNWLPSLPPNPHSGVASAAQMNAPPPTLNDYDGSLLLSVMVPSQDLRPSDLALRLQPPPAFADYRRSFAAPVMSMDGISSLPSVAPDDVQPLAILTPPPIYLSSQTSEKRKGDWRFIEHSGPRRKMFKTPSVSAPP